MKKHFQISSVVLYVLTAIMMVACVISFYRAVVMINKPFPGFLVYKPPYVGSFSSRDWSGKLSGLRYPDLILTADGQSIQYGHQVMELASQKSHGEIILYKIQSKNQIIELNIPIDTFEIKDFALIFFAPFVVGLAVFTLGFIVNILKPNTPTGWVFLSLCFSVGIYGVTGFEIQSSYMFFRLGLLALCLFPANFLHLGLIFPERKKILNRFPILEYLIYLPTIILGILFQIYTSTFSEILSSGTASWIPNFLELSSYARIWALIGVFCMVLSVLHATFRASSGVAKQRAWMILFGVTIAFLPPGVFMFAAIKLGVYFPFNIIAFFTIFFPLFIAYSIIRHNMFDADTIIRRTVGYVIVTTVVVGIYAAVSLILNLLMGKFEPARSPAFPVLFTLGVILVFNPLRDRIQALVDRLFYRLEYDYQETVQKISETMRSLLKLDQIGKCIMDTALGAMFIDFGCVMLLNRESRNYECLSVSGECFLLESNFTNTASSINMQGTQHDNNGEFIESPITTDIDISCEEPLINALEQRKKELTIYDILEDPAFKEQRASYQETFEQLHATLVIPLIYEDRLIGLISLGEKKSGKLYRREDITLLNTLANQGAVAIENAIMLEEVIEKERMQEELSIAKDLQVSMLPSACPVIDGFEIAAYSNAAMEVGGDFYDFIEIGSGKTGLVIGDVTGKSVSGALVMSASRSIFRMLSEEDLTVSDIMTRANKRTKQDIKSGMFVALLYAVLDANASRLSMCSAGQTQPIVLSGDSKETRIIETRGDTFPLGILDDVDYEDTVLPLNPGDKVIFYTDGIVEAMNAQEELFGFERLVQAVNHMGSLSAENILSKINEEVAQFVGEAPQHDDLTIIVLSVDNE
jgi:phosphoserine phosphatase RsbU/P